MVIIKMIIKLADGIFIKWIMREYHLKNWCIILLLLFISGGGFYNQNGL